MRCFRSWSRRRWWCRQRHVELQKSRLFFRLLDLVAQFARERLDRSPRRDVLTARFARGLAERSMAFIHGIFHVGAPDAEVLRVIALPNVLSALEVARDPLLSSRLLRGSAQPIRLMGKRALFTRLSLDLLERLEPVDRTAALERGCTLMELGFSRMEENRLDEAQPILEEGRELALRYAHHPLHSRLEMALARVALGRRLFDVAEAHLKTALTSCDQHGMVGIRAGIHCTLGTLLLQRGRMDEARELFGETLAFLPDTGRQRLRGMMHHNVGLLEWFRLRLAAAEYHFRRAVELAGQSDRLSTVYKSAAWLGQIAWSTGRPEAGRRSMAEAIRSLEAIGNAAGAAEVQLELGRSMLLDGEPDGAEGLLLAALERASNPGTHLVTLSYLAVCDGLSGRTEQALARLDAAAEYDDGMSNLGVIPEIIRFGLGVAERPTRDEPNLALYIQPTWQAAEMLRAR